MTNKFERKIPKVSIIIPSWFQESQDGKYGKNETFWFAQECLKRLLKVTPREDYELIIIDNGSTLDLDINDVPDGEMCTQEYFSRFYADIVIKNNENLGFAPACNQGFELARGEYIICLNNDILLWEGWLDALLLAFKEIPERGLTKPGVVMPAVLNVTRDAREALKLKEIDLKGNFDKYGDGAEFGSLWVAPKRVLDEVAKLNKEELGRWMVFDENFLCGFGEDRKLWQQIRMLGYQTYRSHKTRVFHQGNMSIGKVKDRKQYTIPNREYLKEWKNKHGLQ